MNDKDRARALHALAVTGGQERDPRLEEEAEDGLSEEKQDQALALVADWLGPKMGYDGSAPTGKDAADRALGPQLIRDWDWPSSGPTPTVILEGGPYEWAIEASAKLAGDMAGIGVFCEPYASYALCLYPA